MKPLGVRFKKKNNMYPNFCILHYGEYANFIDCKSCQHARYKPNNSRGMTLVTYKKLRYFLITTRL